LEASLDDTKEQLAEEQESKAALEEAKRRSDSELADVKRQLAEAQEKVSCFYVLVILDTLPHFS